MHQTGITRGAAAGHTAWAGRTSTHRLVLAAMAEGEVTESCARAICGWTDRLPADSREAADEILLAAAAAGLGLRDPAELAGEMYQRSLPDRADDDPGRGFDDRGVRLETTFGGAGALHGDLTPECAAILGAVLDALSAPAGAEDTRTHAQRYHDALAEAMRRLAASDLLPERAGQPVRAWEAIERAVIGQAVNLVSGPGGLASFMRRRQLGARLGGPSLLLDIGYSTTIPAGIRNAVILRDRHCRWPGGCDQPAAACQVHHVKHKANGGNTSLKDCVLLCSFHHQMVIHRQGWTWC